jgi:putative ABC transport system substrate-binding protein
VAEGHPERLAALAVELASLKPDVIFALGGDVAPFARTATHSIPVVMAVSVDPVRTGLVASLVRPGGNVTGVTFVSSELAAKRLQFLKQAMPGIARVAILWNPDHVDPEYSETQLAGKALGIRVQSLEARSAGDLDAAFQAAAAENAEALIVVSARLMTFNRSRIQELAARQRLPVVAGWGPWAETGALFSYGPGSRRDRRPRRDPHRPGPARCRSGTRARRAADQARSHHQPEDGKSAGRHDSPDAAPAGGARHPVTE